MAPERGYLHTSGWAGHFAYPVEVLSRGPRFCRIRLLHKTHIGRVWYPAGTIKHRVPNWSVSTNPSHIAYVSTGGGRFK